jgi:hypothetical protein
VIAENICGSSPVTTNAKRAAPIKMVIKPVLLLNFCIVDIID